MQPQPEPQPVGRVTKAEEALPLAADAQPFTYADAVAQLKGSCASRHGRRAEGAKGAARHDGVLHHGRGVLHRVHHLLQLRRESALHHDAVRTA